MLDLGVIKIGVGDNIDSVITNRITYCGTTINGTTYFGNAFVFKDASDTRTTQLFFSTEIAAYRVKTRDQENFSGIQWKVISTAA